MCWFIVNVYSVESSLELMLYCFSMWWIKIKFSYLILSYLIALFPIFLFFKVIGFKLWLQTGNCWRSNTSWCGVQYTFVALLIAIYVAGWFVWVNGVQRHFQQYFSYIVAISFIVGGYRRTRRNHRLAASHRETVSHNVVHLALSESRTYNISGERHWLHR